MNQRTRRYLELISKQLRDIRMQLWNIPEPCESFTSRSAEVTSFRIPQAKISRNSDDLSWGDHATFKTIK